jgi:hypothetical protein
LTIAVVAFDGAFVEDLRDLKNKRNELNLSEEMWILEMKRELCKILMENGN